MQKETTVERVIQDRLSNEIGRLTGQLIEAQTYNEILIQQNDKLREELESFKEEAKSSEEVIEAEEGE